MNQSDLKKIVEISLSLQKKDFALTWENLYNSQIGVKNVIFMSFEENILNRVAKLKINFHEFACCHPC